MLSTLILELDCDLSLDSSVNDSGAEPSLLLVCVAPGPGALRVVGDACQVSKGKIGALLKLKQILKIGSWALNQYQHLGGISFQVFSLGLTHGQNLDHALD